jgi:hypothetical protein
MREIGRIGREVTAVETADMMQFLASGVQTREIELDLTSMLARLT